MENTLKKENIYNDKGERVATIHGELDIRLIAEFFLKATIKPKGQ